MLLVNYLVNFHILHIGDHIFNKSGLSTCYAKHLYPLLFFYRYGPALTKYKKTGDIRIFLI